ncbi:MAG: GNAT family N-acetyltransferase [Candidatus Hermodarchaeota archaeon]
MSIILDRAVSESQRLYISKNRDFLQIRPANLKDIETLGVLWFYQRCYHEQWDELYASVPSAQHDWKKLIESFLDQPNHCIFIAEDIDGKIVGYIHGSFHSWPMSPYQQYGSLNTIAVTPEAQGQGIGKRLVRTLLRWFKKQNIRHISIHVDYRNQIALKLYQSVGFRPYQQRLMLNLSMED